MISFLWIHLAQPSPVAPLTLLLHQQVLSTPHLVLLLDRFVPPQQLRSEVSVKPDDQPAEQLRFWPGKNDCLGLNMNIHLRHVVCMMLH